MHFLYEQNATTENNYNVKEVWAINYTGDGIVVAVVDEGLNTNHPELRENYVSVSKKLRFSLQLLLHACVRRTT